MIKINRSSCPKVLVKNGIKWTNELQLAATKPEKTTIRRKYKHKEIKRTLEEMCQKKCAYCESKLSHVAYGHIEHFRPFSRFEDLCFDWENLFLSCEICNGKRYKSDKFPITNNGETIINPAEDEPSEHLEFLIDPATKLCYVGYKTARGKITEECLGLNRADLLQYRSTYIKKLIAIGAFAKENEEARNLLEEATHITQPYLAFAQIVKSNAG
jgi:uncharacterized protein (TIGR02646 family)